MNIELDPTTKQHLEKKAQERGKTPEELAQEILRNSLAKGTPTVDDSIGKQQYAEIEKLIAEVDALPDQEEPPDGLSGSEDHNEIIYGRKGS